MVRYRIRDGHWYGATAATRTTSSIASCVGMGAKISSFKPLPTSFSSSTAVMQRMQWRLAVAVYLKLFAPAVSNPLRLSRGRTRSPTALISVLQRMVRLTRPFSVSALYSGVLSHLKGLDSSQITPDGFRIANALDYANALPGLRRPEFRRTPVYFVRDNRHHHYQSFGIQLFPLPRLIPPDGFLVLSKEPSVPSSKIMTAHQAFTVTIRPAGELDNADSDVTRRWIRSIPIPVKDMSVEVVPSKHDASGAAKLKGDENAPTYGQYVQIQPGFDLTQAIQSLGRIESLNREMVTLVKASELGSASIYTFTILTLLFLSGLFVTSVLNTGLYIEDLGQAPDWPFLSLVSLTFLLPLVTILFAMWVSGAIYGRRLWRRSQQDEDHGLKMA